MVMAFILLYLIFFLMVVTLAMRKMNCFLSSYSEKSREGNFKRKY